VTPTLLVGSRPAWLTKLRPHLVGVGIDVRWVWEEPGAPRAGLPPGAALMLIATDCNSHALSESALRLARAHALRVVHLSHRWAQAAPILARAGFLPDSSTAPTEPPESPLAASPLVHPTLVGPPGYPLPPEPIHRAYAMCLSDFLPALALNPAASLAEIAHSAGISRSYAGHMASYGRRTLGLRSLNGTNRFTVSTLSADALIEDEARYRAWCDHLSVRPWSAPEPERVSAPEPAPPPVSGPVSVSAPESKPAPAPAIPEDVRAACALLLDAMRDHGFTRCALRADGSVEWDRTITTTGTTTI